MGVAFSIAPHLSHLWLYFAVSLVNGFAVGSLHAGGNALCLDIWKNDNAGPYMQCIHFSFSLGAFIAPVVAIPFIKNGQEKLK